MEKLRLTLFLFTLAMAASFALSCGTSSISGLIRQPQSITLSLVAHVENIRVKIVGKLHGL